MKAVDTAHAGICTCACAFTSTGGSRAKAGRQRITLVWRAVAIGRNIIFLKSNFRVNLVLLQYLLVNFMIAWTLL